MKFTLQDILKSLVNVANKDGVTPIFAAAIQGQVEAIQLLLNESHGTDVDKVKLNLNQRI